MQRDLVEEAEPTWVGAEEPWCQSGIPDQGALRRVAKLGRHEFRGECLLGRHHLAVVGTLDNH
eukprot:1290581-Prymnesium_polylepis.1